MIPAQLLQNKELRFLRLHPDKKNPVGENWQQPFSASNYSFDELAKEIKDGEGVGLLCGTGKPQLLVIDADKKSRVFTEFQALIEKELPQTFRVQTPHGGVHNYFYVDTAFLPGKKSYLPLNEECGEIRGAFCNIGLPPTKISGVGYKVLNDLPIALTTLENILTRLGAYLPDKMKNEQDAYSQYSIQKVIDLHTLTQDGAEFHGPHPIHGSEGGQNFWVNVEKGVWHCFRHHTGGNALTWCAVKHGLIKCEDATPKALTGKLFIDTAKLYEEESGEKVLTQENFYDQVHSIATFEAIAKKLVFDLGVYYDENQLWWLWNQNDTVWKIADETDIMNIVDSAIQFNSSTLESKVKGIILEGLKREGRKNKPRELGANEIQFKDKIINLDTMIVTTATKEVFALNPIPWPLAENSETPTMDKLMREWVDDKKDLLYETIAFAIAPQYFIHRIICLTGSGRNGKSQFLGVLRKFLGPQNYTSSDLELLCESRFEASKLYRKLVCFMGETNFAIIKKTSMIKRLTGQDVIGIEFKGKKAFDTESYAKIFMATNSLPETLDKTEGFYRRWLIVDFNHKFEEKANIIDLIPPEEYSALATKSIRLLNKLRKDCFFSGEGSVADRKKAYEFRANPISQYLALEYVKDVNGDVPFFEFFDGLTAFLGARGFRLMTKRAVSDCLEELGYEMHKMHPEGDQTKTWHYVMGLRKKEPKELKDTNSSILSPIGG